MAILKIPDIGNLSGKLGEYNCREQNGKTIISLRSGTIKYHSGRVQSQRKFCHGVWLARHCNNIPLLKKIWLHSDKTAYSAYHKLISVNSKISEEGQLTEKNVISPAGLKLEVRNVIREKYGIKAHLEIVDGFLSSPFHAVVVICSFIPGSRTRKGCRFYSILKEVYEDGKEFDLFFNPYPFQLDWINNYQKWIMYFTLVKDGGSRLEWTSTGCKSGFGNIGNNNLEAGD